jgi:MFS family permease
MSTPDPISSDPSKGQSIRAVVAASAGTFIEWYEYGLYAFVAGLVIAPLYFSGQSDGVAMLATFGAFAVGFIARPVGGIVLGAAGDRWGRRPVLVFSIILMGVATTGLGLLPPYASIGIWAPVLLVLMRLLQGFGAGAELAGAIVYLSESTRKKGRAFAASFMPAASLLGSIIALVLFTVLSASLTRDAFLAWGWRVPFLLGAVLTVVGLILRRRMGESPEFVQVEQERRAGRIAEAKANPLTAMWRAMKASPCNWIATLLLPTGLNVTGFVAQAFGISYLSSQIGLGSSETLAVTLVMFVSGLLILPFWGWLSDTIGAKRVLVLCAIGGIPAAFAYFLLLNTREIPLIIVASVMLWCIGWAGGVAAQNIVLPALFRTEYRGSGLTSARELQGGLIAGPAPFIATALVLASGGQPWLVATYLAAAQVVTLIGVAISRPFVTHKEVEETSALRGMAPAHAPATVAAD